MPPTVVTIIGNVAPLIGGQWTDVNARISFQATAPYAVLGAGVVPNDILTVDLEPDGDLPAGVQLYATDDTGVDPVGVEYLVKIHTRDTTVVGYFPLPHASPTFDISGMALDPPAGPTHDFITAAALAAALEDILPTDSDLAAIAALATTAYGRSFLTLATAAAARTYIGAGSRVIGYVTGDRSFPNTTLADITGISMAVEANAVYRVYGDIFYNATAAADLKLGWTAPAAATLTWDIGDGVKRTLASTPTIPGDGTDQTVRVSGLLVVAGTAGTVRLQAAQATSDATATKVLVGAFVELWSP